MRWTAGVPESWPVPTVTGAALTETSAEVAVAGEEAPACDPGQQLTASGSADRSQRYCCLIQRVPIENVLLVTDFDGDDEAIFDQTQNEMTI